jgi:hypothetical protein
MGSFLEKPITEKDTDRGDGPGMTWGVSSMQGWRIEMEVRLQRPVNRWGTEKSLQRLSVKNRMSTWQNLLLAARAWGYVFACVV